jgi:hypothetical protein
MYIIKTHYEATESNPNFVGEHDWYEGKGGVIIGERNELPKTWEINEYGYKTHAGALRGLKAAKERAEHETGYGYWVATADIVEIN